MTGDVMARLTQVDRIRAGQPLIELPPDLLGLVIWHPSQREVVVTIETLLTRLDEARTAADLFEFQIELFREVYAVEERRAGCSRALKRVRTGRPVQTDAPPLPDGYNSDDERSWQFEVFICERVARQLRTVGDALAWKAFQFDRRAIIALSRNAPAGPMVGKEGLGYELGRVEQLWRDHQHFAILHDLTHCLRIADVTEFEKSGRAMLREIKKQPRRTTVAQKTRAQAAVDAITSGGQLPGGNSDAFLVPLRTRYTTDVRALADAIGLARRRAAQGITLPEGRAVLVTSLLDLARQGSLEAGLRLLNSARSGMLQRAGMVGPIHHMRGNSGDSSGRSVTLVPYAAFPLSPRDRAELICDFMTFETYARSDYLIDEFETFGLAAHLVLSSGQSSVVPRDADVLQIIDHRAGVQLTVHAGSIHSLLFEFLRPRGWCAGIAELVRSNVRRGHPEMVLDGEAGAWGLRPWTR